MDEDLPDDELDRLIARLIDSEDEEDPFGDLCDQLIRELEHDEESYDVVERLVQRILRATHILGRRVSEGLAETIDQLGDQIAQLECVGRDLTDQELAQYDKLTKARKHFQEQIFPRERPVAAYHCPPAFIADPEGIQFVLDQTGERFEQTSAGNWESRDSGFCCHADPARFFDNFRLTSRTIRWDDHLPRTLGILFSVRDCISLQEESELDFICKTFERDERVQEQVRIVRRRQDEFETAVAEQRFDDATRIRNEHRRNYDLLNRLCIEREGMEPW